MHVRAAALAGLTALLLTACGGDDSGGGPATSTPDAAASSSDAARSAADLSGPEVAAAAADALERAGAVRLQGSMTIEPGQAEVDLRLQGADVAGTFTFDGQVVQIVALDGAVYMQAPEEFWAAQGAPAVMAARLGGVWVMSPAEEGSGFDEFSVAALAQELRAPSDGVTVAEDVVATSLDGEPVWEIRDSEGAVMHVAAEGDPLLLQMTRTGAEAGVVRFSEFGESTLITPPADYVDLSELAG
ncbi:hypothetical protein [Blastococcus sp. SYSU D00813]